MRVAQGAPLVVCWTGGVVERRSPGHGGRRLVRAATVAILAVGPAVAAHGYADGCLPIGASAGVVLAVAGASWVLTGREVRGGALFGVLALTQGLTHLLLGLACAGETVAAHSGARPLMVLAHLVAIAVSAAGLRVGEAAWWAADRLRAERPRLLGSVGLIAGGVVALPLFRRGRVRKVHAGRWLSTARDQLARTVGRRGPPAVSFAARLPRSVTDRTAAARGASP